MQIWEILLLSVGLAMDAFAVSMCQGLNMQKLNIKNAVIISGFFGIFQAVMPLIGWAVGTSFAHYIESFDHWVAFALLAFLGGKMIFESFKKGGDEQLDSGRLNYKELTLLAIATSIDALAVGITFAFFEVNIAFAVSSIGVITFIISLFGVYLGCKIGDKFKNKAELFGGIVLVLIGLKILLEGLGVL